MREAEIKAATEEVLRPQIAKPLMAAQGFMQDQKPAAAAEMIATAEAVILKSGYERHVIARVKASLAAQNGDANQAAQLYETASEGKWWASGDKAAMAQTIAGLYYNNKEYAQAAKWYARSTQLTGPVTATELLRAQSLYLSADFGGAANVLEPMVQKLVADGRVPSEISLKLLADSRAKTGDTEGFQRAADLYNRFYAAKAQ
jgi:hypothetical protein